MGQRASQLHFSRTTPAPGLGRPRNGRDPAPAVGSRRAGEFRRVAQRKNPREYELHRVQRNSRVLRATMQSTNRHHHQAAARKTSAASPWKTSPAGRNRRSPAPKRKNRGLIAVVPARPAARTRSRLRKIAISRRSRHNYFFQRQHRRTQRRDAHSLQHHVQH